MKTFKQHIKEGGMTQSKYGAGQVGSTTSVSPEDSNMGAHNIENPEVLKKVNAFVGAIAEQEYINPEAALEQLGNKLKTIGLELGNVDMKGANGKVSVEVSQFGGRFGKDLDGSDLNDDGISHRKEGGLKLEVSYETLQNGSSKVFAKLV
jgi:hypothetical protein|tara:strand:+ start:307 stop:756 length:450 start_codon:yes stop_codon:yes gene_type:complete